jgi:hypothetical protein
MNMFITIINDSFRHVRENVNDDHQEIFSFMLKTFLRWTGIRNQFLIKIESYFRFEKAK